MPEGRGNGAFRPQELQRRQFQQATVMTLDRQAGAIAETQLRTKATGDQLAELASRLETLEAHTAMGWKARCRWLLGR